MRRGAGIVLGVCAFAGVARADELARLRAQAHYARARVLLHQQHADDPTFAALDARLDELTGTFEISGPPADASFTVDGAPAERLGDALVLDVGRRELVVSAPGCEPEHLVLDVLPRSRRRDTILLVCNDRRGSLRVQHANATSDELLVDDEPHPVAALSLPTGAHHVELRRGGVLLLDERAVDIRAGETATLDVHPGFRTLHLGAYAGPSFASFASLAPGGDVGLGVSLGIVAASGPLRVALAAAYGTSGSVVDARVTLAAPLAAWRAGDLRFALDLTPLAFAYERADDDVQRYRVGALTLGADHATLPIHAEVTLWPAGLEASTSPTGTRETAYAAALVLRLYYVIGS